MYKQYSDMIHKRVKDNRRLFMHNMNGFMVDKIIEDLAKDILRIIENEGRPSLAERHRQSKERGKNLTRRSLAGEIARIENRSRSGNGKKFVVAFGVVRQPISN